jgi:hypothetical protein
MPATAAPTASPDMLPRTVHDEQNQILYIYVCVSMSPDGKDINIAAPSLAVLFGDWTLRWILSLEDGLKAEFADVPIEIDESRSLPPRVTFPVEDLENSRSYCTGSLSNAVLSANHFKYWINIAYYPPESWAPQVIRHDPTIAVTPDPITRSCLKPTG